MKHTSNALDKKSYHWLEENDDELLQAVENDIKEGATPDNLYRLTLRERDSRKLALLVRAAARYIASQQVNQPGVRYDEPPSRVFADEQ